MEQTVTSPVPTTADTKHAILRLERVLDVNLGIMEHFATQVYDINNYIFLTTSFGLE